jgi:hypothetical protein
MHLYAAYPILFPVLDPKHSLYGHLEDSDTYNPDVYRHHLANNPAT